MNVRIGNQTAFAAANFLDPFLYAVGNRFEAFEWFPDKRSSGAGWDETDMSDGLRAKLKQSAQSAGMRFSVHARWTCNPLQPGSLALLLQDLELARSLGAALLNLHLYADSSPDAFAAALLPLLQKTAASGIQLALENSPETTPQHFNDFFAALDRLAPTDARHAGMCFDLGHANLCAPTRNNYLAYLDQLGPHVHIIHLHVHENWGDTDSHLPLFTGPAANDARGIEGFVERLRARAYTGSLILEQWPQPPTLLNKARDRLLEML